MCFMVSRSGLCSRRGGISSSDADERARNSLALGSLLGQRCFPRFRIHIIYSCILPLMLMLTLTFTPTPYLPSVQPTLHQQWRTKVSRMYQHARGKIKTAILPLVNLLECALRSYDCETTSASSPLRSSYDNKHRGTHNESPSHHHILPASFPVPNSSPCPSIQP